jgi:uncharacterized membrane-anchored protein
MLESRGEIKMPEEFDQQNTTEQGYDEQYSILSSILLLLGLFMLWNLLLFPLRVYEVVISLLLVFVPICVIVAIYFLYSTSGQSWKSLIVVAAGIPMTVFLFKMQLDSDMTAAILLSRVEQKYSLWRWKRKQLQHK